MSRHLNVASPVGFLCQFLRNLPTAKFNELRSTVKSTGRKVLLTSGNLGPTISPLGSEIGRVDKTRMPFHLALENKASLPNQRSKTD